MGYGKCCENFKCAKKNETYDESIDVTEFWEDFKKRDSLDISFKVYNFSKKKNSTLEELQNIFKCTVQDIHDVELCWDMDNMTNKKSEEKIPIINIIKN